MAVKKQISIVHENRLGTLFKITSVLLKKKVNILACCTHDLRDYGVLRIVVDSPGRARAVLTREKLTFSATDVLAIELPHQPGALVKIAKKLAKKGINIEYMYACGAGEKALAIFKVSETSKADQILSRI
jgi:hypothetical protein